MLVSCIRVFGHYAEGVVGGREALDSLARRTFDLLITEMNLRSIDALQLLSEIRERWPETAVIVMADRPSVSEAVEAIRGGAVDYVLKPPSFEESAGPLVLRIAECLAVRAQRPPAPTDNAPPIPELSLKDLKQRHMEHVLAHSATLKQAATRLGIDPVTLWRKRRRRERAR
jgi:DNA-binding NtrC family response regulator